MCAWLIWATVAILYMLLLGLQGSEVITLTNSLTCVGLGAAFLYSVVRAAGVLG